MAYESYGRDYEETYDDGVEQQESTYDPLFVPDAVRTFVVFLYRHIREKNVYEIHQMYEGSFQKLSERMFKESPWPSVEAIAPFVDNDHVFCLLYREMWFRHLYARLSPNLKQRVESWDNYCSLFQVIVHGVVNMQLPNQWLWDMIDEFIYQFQSFCQYRAKLRNKTDQELAFLRECDEVWNVYGVLNYLQALVEKSVIIQILEEEKEGNLTFTATDGYDYNGGSNVLKVLGYFSIIGLLRVHCLLGDYYSGLKCLAPIDVNQTGVYNSVIGSHITTIYYYGFANLMLRRYVEAIRTFNQVLLYIIKTKQFHQKSPQFDQILKKNEQMYALLAICLSICPQMKLVEENVNNQLKEKYGEKMARMQRSDEAVYDELFSYACPKFITPSVPNYDEALVNYNQDAYRLQLKLFLSEVRQQQLLSGLRSFLKLYTSISMEKLANFMDVDESTLRTTLMTYKHKTHAIDHDGRIISNADVDFYIDEVFSLGLAFYFYKFLHSYCLFTAQLFISFLCLVDIKFYNSGVLSSSNYSWMSSDDPMILDFACSSDPSYKSRGFAISIMAFLLLPRYRKSVYIKLGYYVQIFLTPIVCLQVDFKNAFSKVFVRPLCEN